MAVYIYTTTKMKTHTSKDEVPVRGGQVEMVEMVGAAAGKAARTVGASAERVERAARAAGMVVTAAVDVSRAMRGGVARITEVKEGALVRVKAAELVGTELGEG